MNPNSGAVDATVLSALIAPEIRAVLETMPLNAAVLSEKTLAAAREQLASRVPPSPLSQVERIDMPVPGREGVSIRIHRPIERSGRLPCIVWMHGGGLVMGNNLQDGARLDDWCQRFNLVGVSVEYRLAPEAPFPIPLEDCYGALQWVAVNADKLGIDVRRLGVGGASSGGGLAAALARLAQHTYLDLAFQLLIYPMLDDRMTTVSSHWDDPVWPPEANRFAWRSYLRGLRDGSVPEEAAMARATDLAGLPRTFIAVGAIDSFSDEDIDYATRLRHAGVSTELHVYDGAPHGFDALAPASSVAQRAAADVRSWLASTLALLDSASRPLGVAEID